MWCFSIRRTMLPESMRLRLGLLGGAAAALVEPKDAVVIAEHRRKERLEERYGALRTLPVTGTGRCGVELLCKHAPR